MVLVIASSAIDAEQLAEAVARLRRALQESTCSRYPWDWPLMAQMELLQALAGQPGLRLNELSGQLHLAPAAASHLVRDLRVYGLVEWATDPTGRRGDVVCLTKAGLRQLIRWRSLHQRRIASALDRLPPFGRNDLAHALPALTELVEHLATGHGRDS